MLVNITEHFIESGREWQVGQNPDVPREVAARWIADGKATADTDGARNQFPVSGGGNRTVVMDGDSITAHGYTNTGSSLKYNNHGWWVHALAQAGWPLKVLAVPATSSETSQQILPRRWPMSAPWSSKAMTPCSSTSKR